NQAFGFVRESEKGFRSGSTRFSSIRQTSRTVVSTIVSEDPFTQMLCSYHLSLKDTAIKTEPTGFSGVSLPPDRTNPVIPTVISAGISLLTPSAIARLHWGDSAVNSSSNLVDTPSNDVLISSA